MAKTCKLSKSDVKKISDALGLAESVALEDPKEMKIVNAAIKVLKKCRR